MCPEWTHDSMARSEGFEPPTPRFEVWCSIQLSYERPELLFSEECRRFQMASSGRTAGNNRTEPPALGGTLAPGARHAMTASLQASKRNDNVRPRSPLLHQAARRACPSSFARTHRSRAHG